MVRARRCSAAMVYMQTRHAFSLRKQLILCTFPLKYRWFAHMTYHDGGCLRVPHVAQARNHHKSHRKIRTDMIWCSRHTTILPPPLTSRHSIPVRTSTLPPFRDHPLVAAWPRSLVDTLRPQTLVHVLIQNMVCSHMFLRSGFKGLHTLWLLGLIVPLLIRLSLLMPLCLILLIHVPLPFKFLSVLVPRVFTVLVLILLIQISPSSSI